MMWDNEKEGGEGMKEKKKFRLKEFLIALGITLALLGAASGIAYWQYRQFSAAYLPFDMKTVIIVNGVGAVILFLILFHFLKKNKDKENP